MDDEEQVQHVAQVVQASDAEAGFVEDMQVIAKVEEEAVTLPEEQFEDGVDGQYVQAKIQVEEECLVKQHKGSDEALESEMEEGSSPGQWREMQEACDMQHEDQQHEEYTAKWPCEGGHPARPAVRGRRAGQDPGCPAGADKQSEQVAGGATMKKREASEEAEKGSR